MMPHHRLRKVFDGALFVWGIAAAAALIAKGAHDAQPATGWPRWLELAYLLAVIVAVPALGLAAWVKHRLKRTGAVVEDEGTATTHLRAMAVALTAVVLTQVPFFLRVELPSIAQAEFTVAAALLAYGVARLVINRGL